MSNKEKRQLIENLTEDERERIVQLLTRYIIEKRKERVRLTNIKKI